MSQGLPERQESDTVHVLAIAYHFPPVGGAGVQRTVKFLRYLPELGVQPSVLTGPANRRTSWPPEDPTLLREIPDHVPIHRIDESLGTLNPKGGVPWWRSATWRLLRQPTPFARAWLEGCVRLGTRIGESSRPDVLFATMSPFESADATAALSDRLGVPWVADLRDPWALDEMKIYPSRWHRTSELRRMRASLSTASVVVMNTPEAARAMVQEFPEFSDRVVTITNGYDAEDFAGDPPIRSDDRFRIVHAGGLHTNLGLMQRRGRAIRRVLGGMRCPVDILTRSHYFLLQALEKWKQQDPSIVQDVELVLLGALKPVDEDVIERSSAADMVREEGYVDHATTVAWLRSADVLFLPLQNLPPGERTRIVPGKTYEYLAAERPILAAVPEGDTREFIEESGRGHCCRPHDVHGMLAILRRLRSAPPVGVDLAEPRPWARFERRELSAKLASVLRQVASGPRRQVPEIRAEAR